MLGLVAGKLVGIFGFAYAAVKLGVASLSPDLRWQHVAGMALLGGIGFTMSIFITNLAFDNAIVITASKMSILTASVVAALAGLAVLRSKIGGRDKKTVR